MREVQLFEFMNNNNKRKIFHENDEKFKQMEQRIQRNNKIKNVVFYSGVAVLLAASTIALKKQIDYLNQPIQIVTNDIMSNEGFIETDDGRTADPKKFDKSEKDEMYEYARKHGITADEVREQIKKKLATDDQSAELILEQLKDAYPGILGDGPVMHVYPIEGKTK